MRAAVYHQYGSPDVVSVADVPEPEPKEHEVLVQVKAASINAYDWHLLEADPFFTRFMSGMFRPKNNILGADIAGVIAAVGTGSTKFHVGDAVFGCLEGYGKGGLATGGFAEFVCSLESTLAKKPPFLSFAEAAALPMAAVTALQAVRDDAKVKPGHRVLVNGASGGVGMFASQIAKAYGAEVTAVCSTGSFEMVSALGMDAVIDYQRESAVSDHKLYDIVIDVAATLSVQDYRRALKPNGICVVVGFSTISHMLSYQLAAKRDGKRIVLCMANNKISDDLLEVCKLIEAGHVKVVIDSRYSLEEIRDALRHAETGHPKGKVVITVA